MHMTQQTGTPPGLLYTPRMDSMPTAPSPTAPTVAAPIRWWRKWWRGLSPTRQDRFAALAPLAAVQLLLDHTTMDSTVRYLRVDIEDALLSEGIDL